MFRTATMVMGRMKLIAKVCFSLITRSLLICACDIDAAAEMHGTHGVPTEDFQRQVINLNNQYRRQSCAGDLYADDQLHEMAHRIAHDKANNKTTTLSDEYNEIEYRLDTYDPSRIIRRTFFFAD
jgi:uncharacterized protein YkwD